jgi:hypothetical protein
VPKVLTKQKRASLADWLIVGGALALFGSLFLAWSHQFSPSFLNTFGSSELLDGVPHNPTAWQVYSTMDVVLALVALGMAASALFGTRPWRVGVLVAVLVALVFTLHALNAPPTNGANIFNPSLSVPEYQSPGATAGPGETVAVIGLALAILGFLLSFSSDSRH